MNYHFGYGGFQGIGQQTAFSFNPNNYLGQTRAPGAIQYAQPTQTITAGRQVQQPTTLNQYTVSAPQPYQQNSGSIALGRIASAGATSNPVQLVGASSNPLTFTRTVSNQSQGSAIPLGRTTSSGQAANPPAVLARQVSQPQPVAQSIVQRQVPTPVQRSQVITVNARQAPQPSSLTGSGVFGSTARYGQVVYTTVDQNGNVRRETRTVGGQPTALTQVNVSQDSDDLEIPAELEMIMRTIMGEAFGLAPHSHFGRGAAGRGPHMMLGDPMHDHPFHHDLADVLRSMLPEIGRMMRPGGSQGREPPRPLLPQELSRYPTTTFKPAADPKKAQSGNVDKACSVCMCDFESGETLRSLPCTHRFHKECIDSWLLKKGNCPVCRIKC